MTTIPTIELPENEPEALLTLLDAAGKHAGLQSYKAISYFADKIAAAKKAAEQPQAPDTTEPQSAT